MLIGTMISESLLLAALAVRSKLEYLKASDNIVVHLNSWKPRIWGTECPILAWIRPMTRSA